VHACVCECISCNGCNCEWSVARKPSDRSVHPSRVFRPREQCAGTAVAAAAAAEGAEGGGWGEVMVKGRKKKRETKGFAL